MKFGTLFILILVLYLSLIHIYINVTEKIIDLMNQPWFMNHHLIANQDDNYYRQLFEQGYGLFFWMRLDEVTNMRASDADFGILPIPKYEEAQDKYYSMVSVSYTHLDVYKRQV